MADISSGAVTPQAAAHYRMRSGSEAGTGWPTPVLEASVPDADGESVGDGYDHDEDDIAYGQDIRE